ncbi:MAG: alpha-ketoglutarate-dependent dioxygenase AlkB [Pseudomonadota bacterium]
MTSAALNLKPGLVYHPGYLDTDAQNALVEDVRAVLRHAPLFQPVMPRTGKPLSVRMSNCGALGWVADRQGYRYQPQHPDTDEPWPAIPELLSQLWDDVSGYGHPPEACLINHYAPGTRMGLHQDSDEQAVNAPVVSISLGDTALFRFGDTVRGGKTQSIKLQSGDVIVMGGESRMIYHGVDRVLPDTSRLLRQAGRINLTLRRVTCTA